MAKRDQKSIQIVGGWYAMPNWFADTVKPVLLSLNRMSGLWPAFEYVWRMSYGFDREWAPVGQRSIARNIGVGKTTAKHATDWLVLHNLIERREREEFTIGRNKIRAVAHEYRIAPAITDMLLGRIDAGTGLRVPDNRPPDWPPEIKKWLEPILLEEQPATDRGHPRRTAPVTPGGPRAGHPKRTTGRSPQADR